MYTFTKTKDGNVEVSQNGKRITTTTPENAKVAYGYTGPELTLPQSQEQTAQSLPPLPNISPSAPQDMSLPNLQPTGNTLVDFKNTMNYATNLARKKRAALSLQFMQPFSGTVAASDFGSILGNLNNASDQFGEDLLKETTKLVTPKFELRSVGSDLYEFELDSSGKVVGAPKLMQKGTGAGYSVEAPTRSGTLVYTAQDKAEDSAALEASRGDDGYVDPNLYKRLSDVWVAQGGNIGDFLREYPPANYINPANSDLPPVLRSPASKNGLDSRLNSL